MIKHNKPGIDPNDINSVIDVLKSGWIVQGEKVEALEKKMARFLGQTLKGVAVSNGTSALFLALHCLNVGKGDEVIVPTYACTALLNAIFLSDAVPVIVDVDLYSFNICVEEIKKKITSRTKAIIVPHIFGVPADIQTIIKFGIPVIEDCAQSIGAKVNHQPVGTFGDIGIFSFYASKMITSGYGGMMVSKKKHLTEKAIDFRQFDCRKAYKPRFNIQLSDIHASLGLSQFNRLDGFIETRRTIANRYIANLKKRTNEIDLQARDQNIESVFYRFVIRASTNNIARIKETFFKNGIETIVPIENYELLHQYLKLDESNFPNAEKISVTTLSIPIYPGLKESEIKRIESTLSRLS